MRCKEGPFHYLGYMVEAAPAQMRYVHRHADVLHLPDCLPAELRQAACKPFAAAAAELVFPVPGERHQPNAQIIELPDAGKCSTKHRTALHCEDGRAFPLPFRPGHIAGCAAQGNHIAVFFELIRKICICLPEIIPRRFPAAGIGDKNGKDLAPRRISAAPFQ